MTIPGRYDQQIQFYRSFADRIVALAVADENFRNQLLADPVKTLNDEGIPRGVSEDISKELFGFGVTHGQCGPKSCMLTCFWSCKSATTPA